MKKMRKKYLKRKTFEAERKNSRESEKKSFHDFFLTSVVDDEKF